MNDTKHWNEVYTKRAPQKVGWYKPHLDTSLAWIKALHLKPDDPIIDIGGGASTLVDDLIQGGYQNLTVLDLSSAAIQLTKSRLGTSAKKVRWLQSSITETVLPPRHFQLWHDRAVFHFLTAETQQKKYKEALLNTLKIGGYFIIGTFTPDAPPKCSGLPVQRYNVDLLAQRFGHQFKLQQQQNEIHTTPSGVEQAYLYCLFQKVA